MTSCNDSHLEDGNGMLGQVVRSLDRSLSPARLESTLATAVTPDSADRASGGFRSRSRSGSPEGFENGGSSRIEELRSRRNSNLVELRKRMKSSHDALATPDSTQARSISSMRSREDSESEVENIQTGKSPIITSPRLEELRSRRNQRLDELREELRKRSPSPQDALPPYIMLSGTDLESMVTTPDMLVKTSDINVVQSDDVILGIQSSLGHSAEGRRYALTRRSSAPNVYKGITTEMLDDEMLSGLSKLDRLRLRRAHIVEKAQLANANISRLADEAISEHFIDSTSAKSLEVPTPSPVTPDGVPSSTGSAPGRRKGLKRRSSAPNAYKGITKEMLDDEMLSGLSKLDRLRLRRAKIAERAQLANANVSRLTEEISEQNNNDTPTKSLEIPKRSPVTPDGPPSASHGTPARRMALKRRSSAPNLYGGITKEMLDDEMLSGLSKLDRLRLRRAQIAEKAQLANAKVSRLTEEISEHNDNDSPTKSVPSASSSTPGRRYALKRRSSAPNLYKGITKEMLDDEMLSGLSKLDRLRLRRAQIVEKAQVANSNVSRLTREVYRDNDQTKNEELEMQLRDVQDERAKLQRELQAIRAALQEALGERKGAAGADNDPIGMRNMIDELQGQVNTLEEKKIDDYIRTEEALHQVRSEVAQMKEQLDEIQRHLTQVTRENQELIHRNELQQVRHANVTNMWEHRVEGLVSQLRDLQYSLQDLSHARLQERSDLLRHIVLLQKENQLLRNGGIENGNPRIRFWKPSFASSFGNPFTLMPFGSLLITRHNVVKATGNTCHALKPADKGKSHRGVSTLLRRCTGMMTWDTVKNVAWGAGIMGLVLMSSDPEITYDLGPFLRLEISP